MGISYPALNNITNTFLPVDIKDIKLTDEALRIHRSALVIDGHNDLICKIRLKGPSALETVDLMTNQPEFQTDIPRLIKGGIGAQFWAVVGWAGKQPDGRSGQSICIEEIDLIQKIAGKYSSVLEMAYTADDIIRIRRAGKIASLIGIEGGNAIENSLDHLGSFYIRGARYMTLTWAETLDWADSATDKVRHGGLTEFGEKVVLEMNRLGMLVDISHVSAETMRDVLRVSKSPVIASHSSALSLAPTPRNVPDDLLESIAKNGGIVMVNFYPGFLTRKGAKDDHLFWEYFLKLKNDPGISDLELNKLLDRFMEEHPVPGCSVERVVDHIDHIAKTAGIDHVGLGSDFDGISYTPDYLKDVSFFPYITQVLLNRGYKESDIYKILGGNFLRVFRSAEEKAKNKMVYKAGE